MTVSKNPIKIVVLILIAILVFVSGCVRKIDGSYILSLKEVKEQKIDSIQVTFYDSNNRIESPTITLSSKQEKDQTSMDSFMEILKESDEFSNEEEQSFSPPSESSHHIVVTFDNEFILEFYYSIDNNWLIWSNTSEQEGKKIIQYYFIQPPSSSMQEWLSTIEP